jgi:cytochrome P450
MMPIRDLEWRGQQLKRGERIVALLAAANVDPQQFADPERFDIHRHPNPHVAFGAGVHICLGLKLAVAETEIAVEQLFRRYPNLELAIPDSEVRWSRQPGTRGMESLPVRLA